MVESSLKSVASEGAETAATVSDVASRSDTVITMLPSNDHVTAVYDELVPNLRSEGSLLIDSSTVDPAVSRKVAAMAKEKGGHVFVDAPVSGGVGGAEAGTLSFMVGGSDDAFERSKEVLDLMGANVFHCGDVGTGEVAKLCNNLLLAVSMVGTCEAMNLGEKLGIDPKKLAGILNTSTGRCWSSDTYNPYPGVIEVRVVYVCVSHLSEHFYDYYFVHFNLQKTDCTLQSKLRRWIRICFDAQRSDTCTGRSKR